MARDFEIRSRRVQITTNGFGHGTVKLDGLDISNAVKGVRFSTSAEGSYLGEPDTVEIELSISEIEITLLADPDKTIQVLLPTAVVDVLTRLGWTPPADGATTYRIPHEPVCTCAPEMLAANDGVHWRHCPLYRAANEAGCMCATGKEIVNGHDPLCPAYRRAGVLPENCRCFELNAHERYFETGEHDERCPLFITDNQSPDAND